MMGLSSGCFLVWTAKSGEGMKLFLRAARQGLEHAVESASLSGSEPVAGLEGVAFVLLSAAHPALPAF